MTGCRSVRLCGCAVYLLYWYKSTSTVYLLYWYKISNTETVWLHIEVFVCVCVCVCVCVQWVCLAGLWVCAIFITFKNKNKIYICNVTTVMGRNNLYHFDNTRTKLVFSPVVFTVASNSRFSLRLTVSLSVWIKLYTYLFLRILPSPSLSQTDTHTVAHTHTSRAQPCSALLTHQAWVT